MKYTAVIITLVMLPIIVQANKNMILAEKCESSFIGVEYDESLEKECRQMWDLMTKEIKQSIGKTKPIETPISKIATPVKNSSTETKKTESYSSTGSEINCPELNQSGKVIESPREGVTFYFTKEEVKELYPDCKIGTANTTPVSSVPIGKQSLLKISELSSKKSIVVSAEKKSKILDIPNANHVGVKDTKSYESKIIYRNGWNDPRVQYAYNISGGDMDFIKTIEAESKWDVNALGDKGKSFGLCQIHKGYNPTMQKAYRALKTDNEKVKMCYDQYQDWVKRGVIKTRLYGYNVRNKPQNSKSFKIQ